MSLREHGRSLAAILVLAPLLAMIAATYPGRRPARLTAYASEVLERALPERRVTNGVSLVNFDVRGIDTLGEELLLLAAVTGTTLLLRPGRREREVEPRDASPTREAFEESEAVRVGGTALALVALVFGVEVVLHGHLTPGGGFQGGAIAGTSLALIYLARGYRRFLRMVRDPWMLPLEALGALGFFGFGFLGLWLGGHFLENVLPLGATGELWSGGTIFALDLAVGLEVSTGITLVVFRFLHQVLELRRGTP